MRKPIIIGAGIAASLAAGVAFGEATDTANATYVCRPSTTTYAGFPPVGVMQIVDEPGHRVQLCTSRTPAQRAAEAVGLRRG